MAHESSVTEAQPKGEIQETPKETIHGSRIWTLLLSALAAVVALATVILPGDARAWFAVLLVVVLASLTTVKAYGIFISETARGSLELGLLLSAGWISLLVWAALFAPLLPLGISADTTATFGVAGFLPPLDSFQHPLGTNKFGLDILSRLVWGSRSTLTISLSAVVIGLVVGTILGALGGYFGGRLDRVLGVLTNAGMAFPPLILLMIASPVVGRATGPLAIVFAALIVPGAVRMARAHTLSLAESGFVYASQAMGGSTRRIVFREVIPNLISPMFIFGLLSLPSVAVATASLSFLGLGQPQPDPTWGNMIAEGLNGVFEQYPYIVLIPSAALILTVLSFGTLGKAAQRRSDTR